MNRTFPALLLTLSIGIAGCNAGLPEDVKTTTPGSRCSAVLMGYWPPTNEMLRQFSTDPAHNPGDWQGADWRGLGYDVTAYFPEFPPDGNPMNDATGTAGRIGAIDADLRVDYQDTSADFWRLVEQHEPRVLITTSRGGAIGWELEAIEGGHGRGATHADAALDWTSDGNPGNGGEHPTQSSVDPRSWQAITRYRTETLQSALPLDAIRAATVDAFPGVVDVQIDRRTSGNYLSGFLGLHGLVYQQMMPANVAAGHIHVGTEVTVQQATRLMEATLATVLLAHPPPATGCSETP